MAERAQRADIGFQGGQVLAVRVDQGAFDELQKALGDERSERWHQLQTVDSRISLDLSQVVYVRVETEEQRVGF